MVCQALALGLYELVGQEEGEDRSMGAHRALHLVSEAGGGGTGSDME